jgi:PII-like signaling protein
MKTDREAQLLRIYINESDRADGRPLYEVIVREAREMGLAGATALRGIEGFGSNNRVHTVKILRLSEDLPIVVEIMDQADRIAAFLPKLDALVAEGMVTLENVRTIHYRRENGLEPQLDDDIPLESADDIRQPVVAAANGPEITERARKIIDSAKQSAAKSRRVFADSVDVLLAMLCESNGIATRALAALAIDCETVSKSLREAVSRDESSRNYLATLEKKSYAAAKWLGGDDIGTEHLLLALCEIRPSAATDTLTRLGAQPRDICSEVLKLVGQEEDWQRWLADHPEM